MSTMIPASELAKLEEKPPTEFKADCVVSPSALFKVRCYNPTKSLEIGRMQLHIAALITVCEELRDRKLDTVDPQKPHHNVPGVQYNLAQNERARCAATAITHLENAMLWYEHAMKV